jgi:hypothetical protein
MEITKSYRDAMDANTNILDNLNNIMRQSGEREEGNSFYIDGRSGTLAKTFETKRINLYYYASTASNILEIGFNGGHSCLLYLLANSYSKIQLFDLGDHSYAKKCFDYLDSIFPNRLTIIWGDSTKTLKNFKSDFIYDLLHIDGGHTHDILTSDLENCCFLASSESTLIIDDISYHPKYMDTTLTEIVVNNLISRQLIEKKSPFYCPYQAITTVNKEYVTTGLFCEHNLPIPNI